MRTQISLLATAAVAASVTVAWAPADAVVEVTQVLGGHYDAGPVSVDLCALPQSPITAIDCDDEQPQDDDAPAGDADTTAEPRHDQADESHEDLDYSDTHSYVFMQHGRDGSPRRFDPCTTVHYVVNWDQAPGGTDVADVHEAFARIAQASGMAFMFDGYTDEQPADWHRDAYQPARYGDRWAPVLVTWATPESDLLEGPEIGRAGPAWVGDVSVTGMLVLDATDEAASGFEGMSWGAVLLHEIGHVVGLTHPEDEEQVMAAYISSDPAPVHLHDGDREGLRLLGTASGCLATPSPA